MDRRGDPAPRHRPAEQVALSLIAAELPQPVALGGRLDALGDRAEAEVGRQVDDRGDDALVLLVGAHALHERLVDLDEGQRQAAEVRERGVAGAEVVEAHLDAEEVDERLEVDGDPLLVQRRVEQAAAWRAAGIGAISPTVNVNLAPSELAQPELRKTVRAAIEQDGGGVSLQLKIDQSFVRTLGRDLDAPIVSAIVNMAHALDILVVAEGIETEEQATAARRFGCDRGQGHFFAHPLPPEAIPATLAEAPGLRGHGGRLEAAGRVTLGPPRGWSLSLLQADIRINQRRLLAVVSRLLAVVSRLLAVISRVLAVVGRLLAVRARSFTVAPRRPRDQLGVTGRVAGVGDAVAALRSEVTASRDLVALSRGGVAVGRGGITSRRRVVARSADVRSRVGRLLASARRATAGFPTALITCPVCRLLILAGYFVAIGRHLVAVSRELVALRRQLVALGRSLVRGGARLVAVRARLILVRGGLIAIS